MEELPEDESLTDKAHELPDGGILTVLDFSFPDIENYDQVKTQLIDKLQPSKQYFFKANDQEQLNVLLDRAVLSGQKEYFFWPVLWVEEPRELIRAGLFPTSVSIDTKWLSDYVDGIDLETLRFWWGSDVLKDLIKLKRESRWVYRSLDAWNEMALTTASSMGLKTFTGQWGLYRNSKRPINDMAMFRSPLSWEVREEEILRGEVVLGGERWKLLPVTRYAAGMRRGLFYPDKEASDLECQCYCGTFYYYEPESTTFLAYRTSYSSFNKHTAFKELMNKLELQDPDYLKLVVAYDQEILDPEVLEYRKILTRRLSKRYSNFYQNLNLFIDGRLPQDLMLTPTEALQSKGYHRETKNLWAPKASDKKYYAGPYLGLYALEDDYDQAICSLCRRLGIDVLILEKMPGSFQVVTEVLDSRSRTDSLRSLVYLR